jgi:hypothetical protein
MMVELHIELRVGAAARLNGNVELRCAVHRVRAVPPKIANLSASQVGCSDKCTPHCRPFRSADSCHHPRHICSQNTRSTRQQQQLAKCGEIKSMFMMPMLIQVQKNAS